MAIFAKYAPSGVWERLLPDPAEYERLYKTQPESEATPEEPHDAPEKSGPVRYILELGPGHVIQASSEQLDDRIVTIDRRQLGWTSVLADAGVEFPFKDQTFAHVFSSHLFEHLSFAQAEQCARSSYRVLKPFGTIRFYMPNLEYWARRYQD